MLYVSILIEMLRSQPRLMFWLATLLQTAIWWLVPSLFYSAPPGDLPEVLALGHEFQLGTYLGPPLAYWLADVVFRFAGLSGVYLLSQICVVVTYWAVFMLGRATVGTHHAVIAVFLMIGISVMTLPTPDFGPHFLAMALAAMIILHFWRVIGEGRRRYWFMLAIEIGLLLLTSYAGLILLALLLLFIGATERGRNAIQTLEPWFAAVIITVMFFPHLIWLDVAGGTMMPTLQRLRSAEAANTNLIEWGRLLAGVLAAHVGLGVMVGLAAGWWLARRAPAPTFLRAPIDPFARRFVFFLALAPAFVATLLAVIIGERMPVGGTAPHVVLSGLAVVVAAGETITIHRQRIVSFAWALLLAAPPAIAVGAIAILPWTVGVELKVAQPAQAMGRFFAESFERRTGGPLQIVSGDPRLAALVALAAPSRPSLYFHTAPERTPWVRADDIKRKGVVVVWPTSDTAGTPPPDIKAHFPDLVAEVPRAFEHSIQGHSPLARIGWGMIRPQAGEVRPRTDDR